MTASPAAPPVIFRGVAEELDFLRSELKAERELVQHLSAKVEWLTKMVYGPRSERRPPALDPALGTQTTFLTAPAEAVPAAPAAEPATATAPQAPVDADAAKQARNARKGKGADGKVKAVNGGGRKAVNRSLRRVEVVIDVPESHKVGPNGEALVLVGYEESEREEYINAELICKVTKRAKYALPDTREVAAVAPVAPAIVPKDRYGDDLLIEILLRKYAYGLLFYRVLQDLRAMGSDLTDATLFDQAERIAGFLGPVAQAIKAQVLARAFVHVDETPLPTLDGRRTLWAWVGGDQAFFHVGGRGAKELRQVLGLPDPEAPAPDPDFAPGTSLGWAMKALMADAYASYDGPTAEAGIQRLCCWAHARRNFLPVEETPDGKAVLDRIQALYLIEREAATHAARQRLDPAAAAADRHQRRQAEARPLLDDLQRLLQDLQPRHPGQTPMRQAIDYLLDRWAHFTGYLDDGEYPFDNNQAERVIRPIVIGRKNWLFIGSEDAAAWAADLYTVIESCRLAKVDTRAYLRHITTRLHAGDRDYASLTPTKLRERFPRRD
jgi:transposase